MAETPLKEMMKQRLQKVHSEVAEKDNEDIRVQIQYEQPCLFAGNRVGFKIPVSKLWTEIQAGISWSDRIKNLMDKNPGTTYRLHTEEITDDENRTYLVVETSLD